MFDGIVLDTLCLCILTQDFEKELEERRRMEEEEEQTTGWNAVEIDETPVNIMVSHADQRYASCVCKIPCIFLSRRHFNRVLIWGFKQQN